MDTHYEQVSNFTAEDICGEKARMYLMEADSDLEYTLRRKAFLERARELGLNRRDHKGLDDKVYETRTLNKRIHQDSVAQQIADILSAESVSVGELDIIIAMAKEKLIL